MPIVPKKQAPVPVTFRWDPSLIEELKEIAERTGRSMNEAGELCMRWAVQEAKREIESTGELKAQEKKGVKK